MNIIEYADRDMLALDLAGRLASELNEALHNNDRVSLVVPGARRPDPYLMIYAAPKSLGTALMWRSVMNAGCPKHQIVQTQA